jgi:hypothetical protein
MSFRASSPGNLMTTCLFLSYKLTKCKKTLDVHNKYSAIIRQNVRAALSVLLYYFLCRLCLVPNKLTEYACRDICFSKLFLCHICLCSNKFTKQACRVICCAKLLCHRLCLWFNKYAKCACRMICFVKSFVYCLCI